MKLQHITFTGVDKKTSVYALKSIQQEFPIAEFGILFSRNWATNGHRYPSPNIVNKFLDQGLNLSAHLCGRIAKDAYNGIFDSVFEATSDVLMHRDFKRFQLNVATYGNFHKGSLPHTKGRALEFIIQQKSSSIEDTEAYQRFKYCNPQLAVSMLVDSSGGKGIDSGLDIVNTNEKIGYAGGINPDNVGDKLQTLLDNNLVGDFWIDMETGVRTDDWFDIDKVYSVLQTCNEIIKISRKNSYLCSPFH